MIKIRFLERKKGIYRVEFDGHAGYDIEGQDIVCAAVSALAITISQAIEKLDKGKFGQYRGRLWLELRNDEIDDKTNLLLETLLDGVLAIYKEYPDYLDIYVEEEVKK